MSEVLNEVAGCKLLLLEKEYAVKEYGKGEISQLFGNFNGHGLTLERLSNTFEISGAIHVSMKALRELVEHGQVHLNEYDARLLELKNARQSKSE